MEKLPQFSIDLIEELDRLHPVKALTLKDLTQKSKEELAFEAGRRSLVDWLLAKKKQNTMYQ